MRLSELIPVFLSSRSLVVSSHMPTCPMTLFPSLTPPCTPWYSTLVLHPGIPLTTIVRHSPDIVPVQEHGAPLEQPQHQNHSSGMPASETPAISRRNFTPGQERPGRGQYVIEPDGRFLDMAAIRGHVDRRSILATWRAVIVELKITYANHYYAHQGRGVERRVTRVPPQYLDHARRNDEHYYGAGGRSLCLHTCLHAP